MIITDYRIKISLEDILDAYFSKDKTGWFKLYKDINERNINFTQVDINELMKSNFYINYSFIEETFKSLLKAIDTSNITKETFSKLLCLEGEDEEYIRILKEIADANNQLHKIYLYDYEDNDYDHDTSEKLISEITRIPKEDLYPAYYSLLFNSEKYKPTYITNLTSPVELTEDQCAESDISIILY